MNEPTELSPAELDAIRARHEAAPAFEIPSEETRSDDIKALLSHIEAQQKEIELFHEVQLCALGIDGRKVSMEMASGMVQVVGASLAEFFAGQEGAVNYVEMRCESTKHPEIGPLVMTLQRKNGKTPHELRREAEAHAAELQAKVARLEGEHRRRRVDDELPPHGELVVAGYDDGLDPALVFWDEGGEGWEGQRGSFSRRSHYDWWAPIAPGEGAE